MDDLTQDRWFAGFADGEASFNIWHSEGAHAPTLRIDLRADDLPVLEQIAASFGGSLRVRAPQGDARHPVACWHAASKRDLAHLVSYFDRFPLRAKKARDYAIWRRAVVIYCDYGRRASELPALRAALRDGRAYDGEQGNIPEEPRAQLRLVDVG